MKKSEKKKSKNVKTVQYLRVWLPLWKLSPFGKRMGAPEASFPVIHRFSKTSTLHWGDPTQSWKFHVVVLILVGWVWPALDLHSHLNIIWFAFCMEVWSILMQCWSMCLSCILFPFSKLLLPHWPQFCSHHPDNFRLVLVILWWKYVITLMSYAGD